MSAAPRMWSAGAEAAEPRASTLPVYFDESQHSGRG